MNLELFQITSYLTISSSAVTHGRKFLWLKFVLFSLLILSSSQALSSDTQNNIMFVLSGESDVYNRIADISSQNTLDICGSEKVDCGDLAFEIFTISELRTRENISANISVLLGTKAANLGEVNYSDALRINAMIPYQYLARSASKIKSNSFNIFIDQPYSRYFDLIKHTIPRAKRVGILIHESNLDEIESLEKAAKSRGFTLKTSTVSLDQNVGQALSRLLDDIDVLLALPDARIHNSKTISHILTTSYRNNIPVIGFSSAYVKAGATAAVYTSPENIAAQLTDLLIDLFNAKQPIDNPQMAKYFSLTFNYEVARSLSLPTISTREIHKLISSGEAQ